MELIIKELKQQNTSISVLKDNEKSEFLEDIKSIIIGNDKLIECIKENPKSFVSGCLAIKNSGLSFNKFKEQAYIIPYGKSAQVQISYKGYQNLLKKEGNFDVEVYKIFAENEIKIQGLGRSDFEYTETKKDTYTLQEFEELNEAPALAYIGLLKLNNNILYKELWTIGQLQKHAERYSRSLKDYRGNTNDNALWKVDFDKMAKKTVIKSIIKQAISNGIVSPTNALSYSIEVDQAEITTNNEINYIDKKTIQPTEVKPIKKEVEHEPVFNLEIEQEKIDKEQSSKIEEDF